VSLTSRYCQLCRRILRAGEHHWGPRGCDVAANFIDFDPLKIIAEHAAETSRLAHAVQELETEVRRLRKAAAGPWVSVAERLPTEPGEIVVWVPGDPFGSARAWKCGEVDHDLLRILFEEQGVTHWAPLTAPEVE
jgi:hypothetical protein